MKTLSNMLWAVLFGLATSSVYADSQGYVALDNGYRWDRVSQRATVGGPSVGVKGSTLTLKHINSYQLGARGQWNFCDSLFIRGVGHYGWVFDGDYREGGFSGKAKGHTYDIQGAIGYYFCLAPSIWVAPVIGWAYDALNLKGTDIKTAIDGVEFNHLSDIKAHQKFNGPFAGFDLVYQVNECSDFIFGYEFHYARWNGNRHIQRNSYGDPPFGVTTGYSNHRDMHRVYGQVFKFDTTYQFCDCWFIGLGLKYQFFTGDFGKFKRKPHLPSLYTYANIDGLWWRSFASTVYVGTVF